MGWKYGISKKEGDVTLRQGLKDAGHPLVGFVMYYGLQNRIADSNYVSGE